LKTHLDEKTVDGQEGVSYLVKVENWQYFLSLWIDGEATLKNIDTFLRDIWLECCGHMSAFRIAGQRNQGYGINSFLNAKMFLDVPTGEFGELSMKLKAKQLFSPDRKLDYEYDFGSTTDLRLTVIDEYPVKAQKPVVLLSRNEPLEWLCDMCGKERATQICSIHIYEGGESMFCKKCAKKHAKECEDFADYAAMPIVNSPRMGVCAYDGGSIDTQRDGV